MKRLSTLFFLACLFTLTALAHEISAEQSLHKAVEMISGKSYAKQIRGKADFALVHTQKSAQNGKSLYYVFRNEKNGGFVITGADHRANSVLGYTENGTYDQALTIPAFRSWLSSCEAAMQWLSDKEDSATETNLPKFNIPDQVVTNADNTITLTIPGRHYVEDTTLPAKVEPLLGDIVWNQDDPYNRLCPETVVEENGEYKTIISATGCVATATAQVMKYWGWPKQGTGSNKYTSHGAVPVELEADFSQSVYDWENMLDDYTKGFTDEQGNAVAKLMSDVGIAEFMDYGPASGTEHFRTTYALATYFGYNKGIQDCHRSYYTYAEWNDLLKKELSESRPVIFAGSNMSAMAGHEFVLDGYDEDGKYHVNWGWGGLSNGYYDINHMDPHEQGIGGSNAGYPAEQEININCFPDKDGTSVPHYQINTDSEPVMTEEYILVCGFSNNGLAPYVDGQVGFIGMIDNEVVGSAFIPMDELTFRQDSTVQIPFNALDITPEIIGNKVLKIYPAYLDAEGYKAPLSTVAFQNYIMAFLDAEGKLVSDIVPGENANLVCKSIEITRDYAGFDIKCKAIITNEGNCPTFDRPVGMIVYGDNNDDRRATGTNFRFIEGGSTYELEFTCKQEEGKELVIGETYNVVLIYDAFGMELSVPGSETTITMKDPGGAPSPSYSDFVLDKDVIAPNEELTVSFNVDNAGGFYIDQFVVALFIEDEGAAVKQIPSGEIDLPHGTTKVTITAPIQLGEGEYGIGVYKPKGDEYEPLYEGLYFTIKDPATAIVNVTDNTNLSDQYYDLQGRRVANPTKGIYIKDGKKVVKK